MIFSYTSIGIQQFSAKLVLSVYKRADSKRYHIFLVTFFSWGETFLVLMCVNYDARCSWSKIQWRGAPTKVSSCIFLYGDQVFISFLLISLLSVNQLGQLENVRSDFFVTKKRYTKCRSWGNRLSVMFCASKVKRKRRDTLTMLPVWH